MQSNPLKRLFLPLLALLPGYAVADSGFYLGASAGGATFEADISEPSLPALPNSIDEDDTAWKIYAGYRFGTPVVDLGIEAGYVEFGEPDIDVAGDLLTVDTSGLNLWGLAIFDVGPLDVYGKLGLIAWDTEVGFLGASADEDGTDIGYGLGASFGLGAFSIRGEYEIYDLDNSDVSMLSVGLVYQFD